PPRPPLFPYTTLFRSPHQQCDLIELQLGQRLIEEILRRQTEAMYGPLAVLTEKDLVQIGLKDVLLLVMQLQQHRHHCFGELATRSEEHTSELQSRENL